MIDQDRDGVFTAAEAWKCRRCRKVYYPGSKFLVYTGAGAAWVGCLDCAGIYKELVLGLPDTAEPATLEDDA